MTTTTDFFGHQQSAQKASGRLVLYFVLAVIGITLCIYAAAKGLLYVADGDRSVIHWPLLGVVTVSTLAVIGLAMWFKTSQLRSGGSKVAELLGGRRVDLDTKEPRERMLRNLVEEMAIASGVPVPEIFVLDDEAGLNAFAAGWTPSDAAVAVTRGCLEQLDRDELQGVIAHEFSHVFHGDMRLNIRLMGVLFGIVCIATMGRIVVHTVGRSGRSSDKKGGAAAIVVFGLAVMVIGYLGVLFARMIQAAVSRQREFLADASAVQYTRNPRGIGLALAKIGGLGAKLQSAHTEEASHMLFADGIGRLMGGALATHPPLEQRIERVLPGFLKQLRAQPSMVEAVAHTPLSPAAAGFAGQAAMSPPRRERSIAADEVAAAVGDPQPQHVLAARRLLDALPLEVVVATREPERARAIVIALLLDRHAARREAQLKLLDHTGDRGTSLVHDVHVMFQAVAQLDRTVRLPLLELAMPALRRLPAATRRTLREEARRLALADDELSPFEFALLRTIERHVPIDGESLRRMPGNPESLVQHAAEAAIVLSMLARVGANQDEPLAALAFSRGRAHLTPGSDLQLLDARDCSVLKLEAAVEGLGKVSPLGKRNLIAACAEAVAADGRIDPDELDLLRALAELWDCPVPLLTSA